MEEARSSWNTAYTDKHGFECRITLRDEDEVSLAQRVERLTTGILESGGTPATKRGSNSQTNGNGNRSGGTDDRKEKTYIDSGGIRRCNLSLRDGRTCGQPVTEREGRYGLFWSCPSYRDHAPAS